MPDLAELNLVVKSDQVKAANRELVTLITNAQKAQAAVGALGTSTTSASRSAGRMQQSYNSLSATILRVVSVAAVMQATFRTIGEAVSFERIGIAFETLLGSAEKAQTFIEGMVEFSQKTPFNYQSIIDASRFMLALGFNAEEIPPKLKSITEAVTALGGTTQLLDRVILALGQMRAKGVVNAEEMRQLAEAGIPSWDILSRKIGVDIPTAMRLVENRMVDAKTATTIFFNELENVFGGTLQKFATSTPGLFAQLRNQYTLLLRDVGRALIDAFNIRGITAGLVQTFKEWRPIIEDAIRIAGGFQPKFAETADQATKLAAAIRLVAGAVSFLIGLKLADWVISIAKGLTLLNSQFVLLALAVLAFKFGEYFVDQYSVVYKVVSGFKQLWAGMWAALKAGAELAVAGIRNIVDEIIAWIKRRWGDLVKSVADRLLELPKRLREAVGFSQAEIIKLRATGDRLASSEGTFDFGAESAKIRAQHQRALDVAEMINRFENENIDKFYSGKPSKGFFEWLSDDTLGMLDAAKTKVEGLVGAKLALTTATEEGNKAVEDGEIPGLAELQARIGAVRNGIEQMIDKQRAEADTISQGNFQRELARQNLAAEAAARRENLKNTEELIDKLDAEIYRYHQLKLAREVANRVAEMKTDRTALTFEGEDRAAYEALVDMKRKSELEGIKLTHEQIALIEAETRATYRLSQAWGRIQEGARGVGQTFSDFVGELLLNTNNLNDAFESLYKNLVQILVQMLVLAPLAASIQRSAFGLFGGLFGPVPSAKGNVFNQGQLVPFAQGGVVSSPTTFPLRGNRLGLMGESGPEAIVPLARTRDNKLGIRMEGSGGGVSIGKIEIRANDPNTFRRSEGQITRSVADALRRTR